MSLATEHTVLLSDVYSKSPQKEYSLCIDVLEKPLYERNGYAPLLAAEDFTAGLTLQELLPFIDDPWWQKLRRTLFCTFCLIFWLILITACAIAYRQRIEECSAVTKATTTASTAIGILQAN